MWFLMSCFVTTKTFKIDLMDAGEIIYMIVIDDSMWHVIDLGPLIADFSTWNLWNAMYYSKQNVPNEY